MQKPTITIFDAVTNLSIERELTDAEYGDYLEMQKNAVQPLGGNNDTEQPA